VSELFTDRLRLRPFIASDFEAHAEMCADPEVMRYIRAGALSREAAWWQLARYMGHWQLRGFGLWATVERETGRLIGHLGFLEPEGGHGFELGWALSRNAWGKGLATEGVRAALRYGASVLARNRVVCIIQPENDRSIRLAERLGGKLEREFTEDDRRLLQYGLTLPGPAA